MQGMVIGEAVVSGRQDPNFPALDYLEEQRKRLRTPIRQLPDTDQSQFLDLARKCGSLTVLSPRFPERPATLTELVGIDAAVIASDYPDTRLDLSPTDANTILFEANHRALAAKIEERIREGLTTDYSSQRAADFEENLRRWADLTERDVKTSHFSSFATPNASSPLVSVCFSHFNRPDSIVATINAVLSQKYLKKEVIVVDDGSTEENFERLKYALAAMPVRVIRQENCYLGAARNAGARVATGKWVLFKDDDNISKENEIETFVSVATRNDSDVLTCFSDNFKGDGLPTPHNVTGKTRLPFGPDPVYGLIRNGFGDSNCFVRRDVWSKLGGFSEDYRIGLDDHEFFARALASGFTVEVVPTSLFFYRLGGAKMKRFHPSALANERRILRPAIAAGLLPIEMLPIVMLLAVKNRRNRVRRGMVCSGFTPAPIYYLEAGERTLRLAAEDAVAEQIESLERDYLVALTGTEAGGVGRLLNHASKTITGQRYVKPKLDFLRSAMEMIVAELERRLAG